MRVEAYPVDFHPSVHFTSRPVSKFLSYTNAVAWTFLAISLGYLMASFISQIESVSAPSDIRVIDRDISRRAPIVHINEINRGSIVGIVGTGARLIIKDEAIIPSKDRSFSIPASKFLVNIVDIKVPRNTKFVASKRGRKYYPVASSRWKSLKSELLFFRSKEEAEALGYSP